jgi:MFS family permease
VEGEADVGRRRLGGGARRLLVNRDFALLWVGRTISNVGDWVLVTSVTIWIATGLAGGQSWAPLAVSGASIAVAVPSILVAPLSGVFVDRWDKRTTMMAADLARIVLMALLLVTVFLGHRVPALVELGVLYAVLAAETVAGTLFGPAQLALIGGIVEPARRAHAASLSQFGVYLGLVLGPSIAAPLYFVGGIGWALAIDALTFAASLLAVRAIAHRPPPADPAAARERGSVRAELAAGLGFVARHPLLRTLLISIMIVSAGTGALNALNVFFVPANLHASVSLYGFLTGAVALGALVGAPLSGLVSRRVRPMDLFAGSLVLIGVLVLCYSRLTSFAPALVVLFLLGLPQVALNVTVTPLLLAVTPPELVGRVGATLAPASGATQVLGVALAGYVASTWLRDLHGQVLGQSFGTDDTIFGLASLLVIASGAYAFQRFRSLPRHADLTEIATGT